MADPTEHSKRLDIPLEADSWPEDRLLAWLAEEARTWVADLQREDWQVTADGVRTMVSNDVTGRWVLLVAHAIPVVHWLHPAGHMVHALPGGFTLELETSTEWERVTCDTCLSHRPLGGSGAPETPETHGDTPHGPEKTPPGPRPHNNPPPAGGASGSDVPQPVDCSPEQARAAWVSLVNLLELCLVEEREEERVVLGHQPPTWEKGAPFCGRTDAERRALIWAATRLLDDLKGLTPPEVPVDDAKRSIQDRVNQALENLRGITGHDTTPDNVRPFPRSPRSW